MSRQYDDYMANKFELDGELYELIEPHNTVELVDALALKEKLEYYVGGLMHDDETINDWLALINEQIEYIQEYANELGSFDNTILADNLSFLVQKHDIRIGELETFLGISAGYISRTIKEDSKKNMSLDVAWKIARFFDLELSVLLEIRLANAGKTTHTLIKFLRKLSHQTSEDEITWTNHGGYTRSLRSGVAALDIFTPALDDEFKPVYSLTKPGNTENKLLCDVYTYDGFTQERDLLVVNYGDYESNKNYIDIYLLSKQGTVQKVLSTLDGGVEVLQSLCEVLVAHIINQDVANMSPEVKEIIEDYISDF